MSIRLTRSDGWRRREPIMTTIAANPSSDSVLSICFNGAKAEQSYRRYVQPELDRSRPIETLRLPSTSPAHAAMRFDRKLAEWRVVEQGARLTR